MVARYTRSLVQGMSHFHLFSPIFVSSWLSMGTNNYQFSQPLVGAAHTSQREKSVRMFSSKSSSKDIIEIIKYEIKYLKHYLKDIPYNFNIFSHQLFS